MDIGLTHIALPVIDLERSLAFYAKYARMQVVHRRGQDSGDTQVAWISDLTRPFVLVLVESLKIENPLGPFAHLGVAVESLEEFQRLCELARQERLIREGPTDSGPPVGHWAFLHDPNGHTVELSFGQDVEWAVKNFEG